MKLWRREQEKKLKRELKKFEEGNNKIVEEEEGNRNEKGDG